MLQGRLDTLPLCAVCKLPVKVMSQYYDIQRGMTVIEVRCHGDKEVTEIPDTLFVEAKEIEFGEAFAQKRLPAGGK